MNNFFVILLLIVFINLLAQTGLTCNFLDLDGSSVMAPGIHNNLQQQHQQQQQQQQEQQQQQRQSLESSINLDSEPIIERHRDHRQHHRHRDHRHNRRQLKGAKSSNYTDVNKDLSMMNPRELESLRIEYNKFKILSELGKTRDPNLNMIDEDLRYRFASSLAKSRNTRSAHNGSTPEAAGSADELGHHSEHREMNNDNKQPGRSRRSLACSEVKNDKDTCCLESFYVNFTQIGWDKWILYPSGYSANYCRGQCDLSHARYYHSTLLSKFSHIIGLCCSPRQMAPLHLLYIDEDNKVHQKSMPNMVVESCDCA